MSSRKYRDLLVGADHDASRDYDTAVLSIASGALALSATFAHDIAPHPHPNTLWIVAAAWVLLTLSLVAILVSLLTSQAALRKAIRDLDEGLDLGALPGGRHAAWTLYLNRAAGGALVLGLVSLAVFALTNL